MPSIKRLLTTILIMLPLLSFATMSLSQAHARLQQLQQRLEQTEQNIANISAKQDHIEQQLKQKNHALTDDQQQQTKLASKAENQEQALIQHIQSAYIVSRQSLLKLILNAKDPNSVNRIFMYYHYLNQGNIEHIDALEQTLTHLKNLSVQITAQVASLTQLQQQLQQQKTAITLKNQQRAREIYHLTELIKEKHLSEYAAKQAAHNYRQHVSALTSNTQHFGQQSFATLKGKLPWPTPGRLVDIYGHSISGSDIRWHGILIMAPAGQAVHAVAAGKVVFARWLTGFGFLMIIDHGQQYMTLYARNQRLLKKTGDVVHKGDTIATVGRTGGYDHTALYFAIRYKAQPINPLPWLSR